MSGGKPKLITTLSKKVREVYEDLDDRIVAHLCGKCELDDLTYNDKKMMARTLSAHKMMCKGYTNYKVIKIQCKIYGISKPTAQLDLRRANKLLGKIDGSTDESRWAWLWEVGRSKFAALNKKGFHKEAGVYFKELVKIAEIYKSEPLEIPEANQFVINIIGKSGKSKIIDLDNLNDVKDIPYEEIIDGIDQETYSEEVLKGLLTPDAEKGA